MIRNSLPVYFLPNSRRRGSFGSVMESHRAAKSMLASFLTFQFLWKSRSSHGSFLASFNSFSSSDDIFQKKNETFISFFASFLALAIWSTQMQMERKRAKCAELDRDPRFWTRNLKQNLILLAKEILTMSVGQEREERERPIEEREKMTQCCCLALFGRQASCRSKFFAFFLKFKFFRSSKRLRFLPMF